MRPGPPDCADLGQYSDMWSRTMQAAAFAVCLIGWLEADRLLTKAEVQSTLAIDPAWHDHFDFSTEDYLHALVTLISELARLSPNSVTVASANKTPINVPLRVSRFVKDLSGGFQLLNLKNDSLRRRFDAIKVRLVANGVVCRRQANCVCCHLRARHS